MNKKTIIGAVILVVVLVLGGIALIATPTPAPVQAPQSLGDISINTQEFPAGVKFGDKATVNWTGGQIGARSNQASFRNTTGRTIYVDLAEMVTTGTASSTYQFFVATSTTATRSDNFTDPFSTLIDAFTLATSTTVRAVNSIKDAGTNGRSVIPVTDGQYVLLTFQQTYNNTCNGSLCETATSTNRGFNVNWFLRYHY